MAACVGRSACGTSQQHDVVAGQSGVAGDDVPGLVEVGVAPDGGVTQRSADVGRGPVAPDVDGEVQRPLGNHGVAMGREHPLTGRSADPRANLSVVAVRCDHVAVRWDHPVCPGARRLRSNGRTHRRRRQVDHASRHDQHDPIGHGRQRLGERADSIEPPPGPPSGRPDAATDLLGDDNHAPRRPVRPRPRLGHDPVEVTVVPQVLRIHAGL